MVSSGDISMGKVYVLMGGCIDDQHVIGVFSSEEKATMVMDKLIKEDSYYNRYPDDLYIDSYELDEIPN